MKTQKIIAAIFLLSTVSGGMVNAQTAQWNTATTPYMKLDNTTANTISPLWGNSTLNGNAIRIQTTSGYVDIGPQTTNTLWCHFSTDRGKYYFNKPIHAATGEFSSYYNTDLKLQTGSTTNPYDGVTRITVLNSNGNVGIGTTSVPAKLTVAGNAVFGSAPGGSNSAAYIRANNGFSTATTPDYTWWYNDQVGLFHPASNVIGFSTNGVERVRIDANGSLCIGTTAPGTCKLAVEGKIGAREVQVLTGSFPDYVFEANYSMMTLKELETYLQSNKHLPNIPSAKEVEANKGINLGEMQVKHLEKTEELYLYIIELNKKVESLERQLEVVKK